VVSAFSFSTRGTRFSVFAQAPETGFAPEVVRIRARPGSIGPGPRDASMHVVDACRKFPYRRDADASIRARPPYRGRRFPAVRPRRGHFDHLVPGTRSFDAAHTFAVVRVVMEIWEHHLGRRIPWYFEATAGRRLEIIPRVSSNNAWSGEGYLELGYPRYPEAAERVHAYCRNFEWVAHETGHFILKAVIGTMPDDEKSLMHRAHEEAAADLVALLSALHFDSVLTFALERTGGKFFSINPLSRLGVWGARSDERLRTLYNDSTMGFARTARRVDKYRLARPFEGAVFDAFVEIFEARLVALGAIPATLARASRHAGRRALPGLRRPFEACYRRAPASFRRALAGARDDVSALLARTWITTARDGVTFSRVLSNMLATERRLFRGRYAAMLRRAFARRQIAPAP
jgi:hypothetical protein